MIEGCGVIWLTLWTAWNFVRRERGPSGYSSFGIGEHPAGKVEHFYRRKGLGEEASVCLCVVRGSHQRCSSRDGQRPRLRSAEGVLPERAAVQLEQAFGRSGDPGQDSL